VTRPPLRPSAVAVPALLAALAGLPAPASAQIENCEFLPGTQNWTSRSAGTSTITYVSRPRIRCNDGRYIEADSAVSFSSSGYTELIGRVYFQDASQGLRARQARYYDQMRRLEADGEVVLTDRQSGNVMTGERLLYLREMPGRLREELTMTGGRPTATLYTEAGSDAPAEPGPPPAPYEVEADRLYLLGDALFRAFGDVEVVRDSLDAQSDTMNYDREAGVIDFVHEARLRQGAMDLRGNRIQVILPGEVIQEIVATREAVLVGEEIDLEAHLIHLYFTDEALDRLVAVGERRFLAGPDDEEGAAERAAPRADRADPDSVADPAAGRALARAEGLVMSADSIEVLAPAETLERVTAIGGARAVSTARDSLNTADTPELVRHDWIEGDTVVAFLRPERAAGEAGGMPAGDVRVPAAEADPAAAAGERPDGYVLERLIASVNARSLYRMDPAEEEEGTGAPPEALPVDTLRVFDDSLVAAAPHRELAVHYVEADHILIVFLDGAVDVMEPG
jgi:lipopolysaccharide export system protein LptA